MIEALEVLSQDLLAATVLAVERVVGLLAEVFQVLNVLLVLGLLMGILQAQLHVLGELLLRQLGLANVALDVAS